MSGLSQFPVDVTGILRLHGTSVSRALVAVLHLQTEDRKMCTPQRRWEIKGMETSAHSIKVAQ